jgi:hypothetical protein
VDWTKRQSLLDKGIHRATPQKLTKGVSMKRSDGGLNYNCELPDNLPVGMVVVGGGGPSHDRTTQQRRVQTPRGRCHTAATNLIVLIYQQNNVTQS